MTINTKEYIEKCLKIKTKESEIVPFKLNKPQLKLYEAIKKQAREGKPIRIIILKARQMGFSTVTEALIFKRTATAFGVTSGIVTHKDEATTNLFNMSKLFYEKLPKELKPETKASNAKELIFDNKAGSGLKSKIKCMTAGGDGVGRSDTYQNLHISEYAFWKGDKKETLAGLMQSVPASANSMVIIESTANGYDDFKDRWDSAVNGESDFVPVFFAWWELEEYRRNADGIVLTEKEKEIKKLYNLDDEQIAWRRWKLANDFNGDEDLFKQEFPACPEEAFLSSGNCIFDKESIVCQIEKLRNLQTIKRGYFDYKKTYEPIKNGDGEVVDTKKHISDIKFVESESGYIEITQEPEVKKDKEDNVIALCPYAIGADTAEEGSDYFAAKVLNNISGQSVATLHIQFIDEDLFADQVYCLGRYYNDAIIGIEINYSRKPVRDLVELEYPNIYMRERIDTVCNEVLKEYGFRTDKQTKNTIISGLVEIMRQDISLETDVKTLKEMLVFVRKQDGKKEALDGYHDDLVMSLAIAHFVANSQGKHNWISVKEPEEDFIKRNFNNEEYENNSFLEW